MNEHNLIPFSERSESEARENGRKGGIASGTSRRRKKDMKAKLRMLLDLPVNDCEDYSSLVALGIDIDEIDNETLMLAGLFSKAKSGDVQAIREIRSILGKDNAAEELKIHKQELKLRQEAARSGAPGEQELPLLFKALEEVSE